MTPPASTCPYCLQEGWPTADQTKRVLGRPERGSPLTACMRFTCSNTHEWLTDREEALLQGAFLERQRAV